MNKTRLLWATAALMSFNTLVFGQTEQPQIWPTPQEQTLTNHWFAPTSYQLKGISDPDPDGLRILKEILPVSTSGLPLEIITLNENDEAMRQSGAYTLHVTSSGIQIGIVDGASLFYAAQTLEQLAKRTSSGQLLLPECQIKDYPDVLFRGTVEGFYGQPWSHEDRLEQLRFYGKTKLNTYIYGPKDDPYHSSPNWREPYPADQARHITELTEEAARNKVNFVWAIHPGKDIQWNKTDSLNILAKFENMYELGVRSFAVFFDDISGEGAKPHNQASLLNYINREFIAKKKDTQPLIMCPTEYNKDWARTDYLDIIGKELDPEIQIMWTGDRVVTNITKEGIDWVNKRIQRPAYIWWNFPVSDYCQDHLLMGAAYGLDTEAAGSMSGFVSNPMEHAEASKVAIFGIGMYTWNISDYDPSKAWEEACAVIAPEVAEAFKIFCEHNADPGPNWHIFRRDESLNASASIEKYTAAYFSGNYDAIAAHQLDKTFSEITTAADELLTKCQDKNLMDEIRPWVIQFGHLGQTGHAAIAMGETWAERDFAATWDNYLRTGQWLDSMRYVNKTLNQEASPRGVKVGSRVLAPFLTELYQETGQYLLSGETGKATGVKMNIPSLLTNVEPLTKQHYMEDGDLVGYPPMFETMHVAPGQYIGFSWDKRKKADYIFFNLPQSNREGRQFEWSVDGTNWQSLDVPTTNTRDTIRGIDPTARYVRLINQGNETIDLNFRAFVANVKDEANVDPTTLMTDLNLDTYNPLANGQKVEIDLDKQGGTVTLFTSGKGMLTITAPAGKKDRLTLYKGPAGYIQITPATNGKIEIQAEGEARIHEIIKK